MSRSSEVPDGGPQTVTSHPGLNSGAKNRRPWMWSRWRCVRRMWIGPGGGSSASPSARIPVPASSTIVVPSESVTWPHDVLPP